ncbi:cupin domain-containing protein [Roseovarius salinarum]|uniref:cupin domain-containing protein n=1 Tax=Roseovarius salinarum TaxID=1981892 RepID=UPI000C344741|nr:cupin domain-containing protein [Roseovarius salinarum]
MTADEIIETLGLAPHPEGGWFRETWRHDAGGARAAGTCIHFLLEAGQHNHWHRVDAAEIWHFYAGTPLDLLIAQDDTGPATRHALGPDLAAGQRPQVIVPAHHWQRAVPGDGWALVGCTVSPGFTFDAFTLAPAGFDIPERG